MHMLQRMAWYGVNMHVGFAQFPFLREERERERERAYCYACMVRGIDSGLLVVVPTRENEDDSSAGLRGWLRWRRRVIEEENRAMQGQFYRLVCR